MRSNIQQLKMENPQTVMGEKLGFFGLLKESLSILFKNPNFILLAFLTSVPLFCSLCIYEIIFQQTLIEVGKLVLKTISPSDNPYDSFNNDYEDLITFERWIGKVSQKLLLLGLIYVGIIYFLDLLNTIAIVDITSVIYKEEKAMSLRCMFNRFINETRLKGPLITSIYVVLLASLISIGLVSLAPYAYVMTSFSVFFVVIFLVIFLALLTKYIEWTAIWNMGIVISILEDKQGDVAIIVSSHLSRGSRLCGFVLVLIFFAWRLVLRLVCLYAGWETGGINVMGTTLHIGLVCLLNFLKWVVFVVYFYNCKKQSLEKKFDTELGSTVEQSL